MSNHISLLQDLKAGKACTIEAAAAIESLEAENAELKSNYYELLYQVATKFPDETRHETALRYIRQAENHTQPTQQEEV